jgi:ABC-type glycerol-3-phosphate transport system substrate-binding protein
MASFARLFSLSVAIISMGFLLGCEKRDAPDHQKTLRGIINVLVSLDGTESFSKGKLEEQAALAQRIATDYRYLNPGVHIQIELTRESDLVQKIRSRNNDGLSPDLILASGRAARRLHDEQLSRPAAIDEDFADSINPGLLQRLRVSSNTLVGVPVFLIPQLACFNQRRLAKSPTSLNELINRSDAGIEIGMALDMVDLFWTVGAWGGAAAVQTTPSSKAVSTEEKEAILAWLKSLLDASKHLKVNFYDSQEELIQGFSHGRLDWITCRSSNLTRLRRTLGNQLGVESLPSGYAGPASPITVSKAWVFGKNSTNNQRNIANSFVHFSVNAIMQRYTALTSEQMLPVNPKIPIATAGSQALRAMVISEKQSEASGSMRNLKSSNQKLKQVTRAVTEMIYGESTPEQARAALLGVIQ